MSEEAPAAPRCVRKLAPLVDLTGIDSALSPDQSPPGAKPAAGVNPANPGAPFIAGRHLGADQHQWVSSSVSGGAMPQALGGVSSDAAAFRNLRGSRTISSISSLNGSWRNLSTSLCCSVRLRRCPAPLSANCWSGHRTGLATCWLQGTQARQTPR